MLRFTAQYLDVSGHSIREHIVFAETLADAYESSLKRAALPVDPIPAAWVTIKEDPCMFAKVPSAGNSTVLEDAWASPFKPVRVVPVPPLELDVNGRIVPPRVMP